MKEEEKIVVNDFTVNLISSKSQYMLMLLHYCAPSIKKYEKRCNK